MSLILSDENKHKLASILDIYQKFTGEDPHKVPMRIFPAVHYSMGGGMGGLACSGRS